MAVIVHKPQVPPGGALDYRDFMAGFLRHGAIADIRTFAELAEGNDRYPLLVVTTPGKRTLLITAGFHGDETAGPLTLLKHLPEIVDYARSKDVGLRIYPSLNPSGFTDGTRYNRSGESPNNDFLRYEITPGVWVGELRPGQNFLRCEVHRGGPKETRALCAELETLPAPEAALDIHQDPWLGGSLSYAYTFGLKTAYLGMVKATAARMTIARSTEVDDDVRTDGDGLIELHDGSVTDYMFRRGVPYTAALETTTTALMPTCHAVNLVWIRGFVDLAAR